MTLASLHIYTVLLQTVRYRTVQHIKSHWGIKFSARPV